MRISKLMIAMAFAFVSACATQSDSEKYATVAAAWERCETYRDASVCAWTALVRRGGQACAVRQDFATNAYYTHRLLGVVDGEQVRFTRICGDPGSETDSFCTGQAPDGAEKVGWTPYHQTVRICDERLVPGGASCAEKAEDDMTRVAFNDVPLSDDDRAWLTACAPQ